MRRFLASIPIHWRVAILYALFGGVWILFSDRILAWLVYDPILITQIQTVKGWFYVLASAAIIYLLLRNDPTLRKRAEAALQHSEERYRLLVDLSPEAILIDRDGRIDFVNTAGVKMLGASSPEQIIGKSPYDIFHPDYQALVQEQLRRLINDHTPLPLNEEKIIRLDGEELDVEVAASTYTDSSGEAIQMILRDITSRKQADAKIEQQTQHLASLSAIEMAIISSLDLRVTLDIFLERVISQLNVDAAFVVLLKPHLNSLEFFAGQGFRGDGINRLTLRVGEDYAGKAAAERQLVSAQDLTQVGRPLTRVEQACGEAFAAVHAVPLLAKGKLKGVLEVLNRSSFAPDQDWLDFLATLARQAAIAIDNTDLFEGLQRSNDDLTLAYDETIEGWSRAMDLRDHETEGHTQRVTNMAIRLAARLGLDGREIGQIRRGALLHDIGKMGVPDSILLKNSSLTQPEWVIMRKHPVYAYQLLNPISYLQPATDIPHYHHEKWDGSGYPEGLSKNKIPLAARLFALVDVWDALSSNRPYRPMWPEERVREYIKSEANHHFDPELSRVFLDMLDE